MGSRSTDTGSLSRPFDERSFGDETNARLRKPLPCSDIQVHPRNAPTHKSVGGHDGHPVSRHGQVLGCTHAASMAALVEYQHCVAQPGGAAHDILGRPDIAVLEVRQLGQMRQSLLEATLVRLRTGRKDHFVCP